MRALEQPVIVRLPDGRNIELYRSGSDYVVLCCTLAHAHEDVESLLRVAEFPLTPIHIDGNMCLIRSVDFGKFKHSHDNVMIDVHIDIEHVVPAPRVSTGTKPRMTSDKVRAACGLLPWDEFLAQRAAAPWEQWPATQPRPLATKAPTCRKCAAIAQGARAPRAHHHRCALRGACHYRRGVQERRRAWAFYDLGDAAQGRTTKMLCEAVAAAWRGEDVIVVGYSQAYARRLVLDAMAMAGLCEIDAPRIRPSSRNDMRRRSGADGRVKVFPDHYRGEPSFIGQTRRKPTVSWEEAMRLARTFPKASK